ncbi:hypothetical protein F5Y18DRAFT_25077 [Xylariaceae sp. FL1019]|nr:hypothetical protein F5Y18DRAFT_25077 [Xylariaceae sp. FL1019]
MSPSDQPKKGWFGKLREKWSKKLRSRSNSSPKATETESCGGHQERILVDDKHVEQVTKESGGERAPPVTTATHDAPVSGSDDEHQPTVETNNVVAMPVAAIVGRPSDLWSDAYREAVETLGDKIDKAILDGHHVTELFEILQRAEKEASATSVVLRGVNHLKALQVPLETFKLALDVASPFTNIEPVSSSVFSIVRNVTAIAISISTVDTDFARQIGDMIKRIAWIDDCDTLGQQLGKIGIHQALVFVYQKLLEFYSTAYKILTGNQIHLVMSMILQTADLPQIVTGFLQHADHLAKLVGNATLEIGKDIKDMLYDEQINGWLGTREKLGRGTRFHQETKATQAPEACEWILQNPHFTKWHQAVSSEQVAVLGDMGSGKTTLMAFVVEKLSKEVQHEIPGPKICFHYCRNDETGEYLYVVTILIITLLKQLVGLKKSFYDWYQHAVECGNLEPATDAGKLEEFLRTAVESLDRPLYFVIDGLDECDRASRKNLIGLFGRLSHTSHRLKVIFSARPEPEILDQFKLSGIPLIDLASNDERDRIIAEKTVMSKLDHLADNVKAFIIDQLSKFAKGSAIWTSMVVKLLEVRKITAFGPIRRFLDEVPQPENLYQLYLDLFRRYTSGDSENQELAACAVEILAASRRTLSIGELVWVVTLATARDNVTTIETLRQLVDPRRVMTLINPFISRVDHDHLKKRQVRLAHQSIKTFVIQNGPLDKLLHQEKGFAENRTPERTQHRTQTLEAKMLDLCVRYLLLDDMNEITLFSDVQIAFQELPPGENIFAEQTEEVAPDKPEQQGIHFDPIDRGLGDFWLYASCYWNDHLSVVEAENFIHLDRIERLCQAGSRRLQNWTQQNCRPDCLQQAKFEFDYHKHDPLSIISLYATESAFQHVLKISSFDMAFYHPDSAVQAADQILQFGDMSRLRGLVEIEATSNKLPNLKFFKLLMQRWSFSSGSSRDWNTAFDLVLLENAVTNMVHEHWGWQLFYDAARVGCLPIICRLMSVGEKDDSLLREITHEPSHTPRELSLLIPLTAFGVAVVENHLDIVRCLLEHEQSGLYIQYNKSSIQHALQLSTVRCNPAMWRLLSPSFKDSFRYWNLWATIRDIFSNPGSRQDVFETATLLLTDLQDVVKKASELLDDPFAQAFNDAANRGDLGVCEFIVETRQLPKSETDWRLRQNEFGEWEIDDKEFNTQGYLLSQIKPDLQLQHYTLRSNCRLSEAETERLIKILLRNREIGRVS